MNVNIYEMMFNRYKINKPIRLIELFAGYGSQALALKYLGVKFEHWKISEWAIKSIQAYKDMHFTDKYYWENTEDCTIPKEILIDTLYNLGISSDYNKSMSKKEIQRLSYEKLIRIYENILITNNLVNVQNINWKDLEIRDTDKFTYLLTYSFPCQDLSLAGKRMGMKDNSTRSGMLWEVERILNELHSHNSLPQVLLMENVPQVHGSDNIKDFNKWQLRLEELGYKNYTKDLIATDYGIPQTRNRCFMISILGDYYYEFPKPIPLKLKLKDMLEENVDEKYFLSDKMINFFKNNEIKQKNKGNGFKFNISNGNAIAKTITTRSGSRMDDNFIEIKNKSLLKTLETNIIEEYSFIDSYNKNVKNNGIIGTITTRIDASNNNFIVVPEATKKGYTIATDGDRVYINRPHQKRGVVQKDKIQTLKTNCDDLGVVVGTYQYAKSDNFMNGKSRFNFGKEISDTIQTTQKEGIVYKDLRIRKLSPLECWRLMGVKDEDFEKVRKNQSDSSLYHLAGDSIVVNILCEIFKQLLQ